MELNTVRIDKPAETNFILGQSHFIKTIEDLHEAIVQTVPQMKFGIAFCESSGPALVRWTGNDAELIDLAKRNALTLACGHCFIIFISDGFPVNILNTIKAVPEVCGIYCATANPVEVIVAETEGGRGILGPPAPEGRQHVEREGWRRALAFVQQAEVHLRPRLGRGGQVSEIGRQGHGFASGDAAGTVPRLAPWGSLTSRLQAIFAFRIHQGWKQIKNK